MRYQRRQPAHEAMWYDACTKRKEAGMLRRLLSALGVVEIIIIVAVVAFVVVAIRQVLQ